MTAVRRHFLAFGYRACGPEIPNTFPYTTYIKVDDFTWTSVGYFYTRKNYWKLGQKSQATAYFKKVDSIFNSRHFILPELVENFKLMVDFYKEEGHKDLQLYYTNQLIKADRIITQDFVYLSSKIYKEYDIRELKEEKNRLEKKNTIKTFLVLLFVMLCLILFIILIKDHRRKKQIRLQYDLLLQKLRDRNDPKILPVNDKLTGERKNGLSHEIEQELLIKLKTFEENHGFTRQGLNLNKLAQKLGTNTYYLSIVINDYKGGNFSHYLGVLRISYITRLLYEDRKFLHYTIEALARECGMASRQNFSDLFYDINGIRPKDFIHKRLKELEAE